MHAPMAAGGQQRLAALNTYNIRHTDPEQDFDDLSRLAAQVCHTPVAIISLVDESRQWFKSRIGIAHCEEARDHSFCSHVIVGTELVMVPDAKSDPRFWDDPCVKREPG